MKIPKLKDIKDFSLLVVSNHSGIQTKSYSLNIWRIVSYLSIYSLGIVLLTILIFALTPVKYLFVSNESALKSQNEEMIKLNKRVIFLSSELEEIASLNKKLKNAIVLGDSSLAKVFNDKKQAERKNLSGNPNGSYLFAVVKKLFFTEPETNGNDIYFIYPVESRFISRAFNAEKGHIGLDFPIKAGQPVFASSGGIVIFADYTAEDGNMIMLMHKNGYISVYKHCSILIRKIRDKVIQGETIALSGNTGLNTSGPHLHFEIWRDGQAIDPNAILTQ